MSLGLVGRKVGMTRVFTDDGDSIPVTVVDVSDNRVAQIKTPRAARAPRDPNAPRAPQGPSFSRNGSKIIRVLDLSRATKKGNRGTVINLMSDGQTIAEYKAALTAVNLGGMAGWALTYATSQSAITIEG